MTHELQHVSFRNGQIDMAGDLWLPDGFDQNDRYAALIIATPGSSVKEQIGANYGSRMADRGFVVIAFDPSHQGQSGGEPRDLEDPATRIEDIRCAVDFLTTLDYVDEGRIGILGVCAGGGYAVSAAMIEHRIRAVGTVVAVNIGRARRQGDVSSADAMVRTLEAVGAQRSAEARGGGQRRDPWIPDTLEEAMVAGITDRDVLEAVEFYRTPRGYSEHSTNRRLFTSTAALMSFDAFHLVGELLTQPLQVIVGGRRGSTESYEDGLLLWERARNKEGLIVIDGAGHYDMYDKPTYVDQAVDRLEGFYREYLRQAIGADARRTHLRPTASRPDAELIGSEAN